RELQTQLEQQALAAQKSNEEQEVQRQNGLALQCQLDDERASTESLRDQLRLLQEQMEEVRLRRTEDGQRLQSLTDELAAKHLENSRIRIQMDELGRHVSVTDQEKEALVQRLDEMRQAQEASTASAAGVAEENARLGQTVAQLAQQVDEYKGLLDLSGEETTRLQERIRTVEAELSQRPPQDEAIDPLKSRIAELEAVVNEKTTAVTNLTQELEDQKNHFLSVEKENEQHKHHAKSLEETTKQRVDHVDKVQRQCEEQKLTIRQMKLEMDKHT